MRCSTASGTWALFAAAPLPSGAVSRAALRAKAVACNKKRTRPAACVHMRVGPHQQQRNARCMQPCRGPIGVGQPSEVALKSERLSTEQAALWSPGPLAYLSHICTCSHVWAGVAAAASTQAGSLGSPKARPRTTAKSTRHLNRSRSKAAGVCISKVPPCSGRMPSSQAPQPWCIRHAIKGHRHTSVRHRTHSQGFHHLQSRAI